jgi:mannose-6-phosphate isomerase class I
MKDLAAAERLAARLIVPRRGNFVARPWGGLRMAELKGLSGEGGNRSRIGEAFELAADDSDREAAEHPSIVSLGDDSAVPLPRLLEEHAETLLGPAFVRRYGRRWPLLPKTLDVAELLSVQGHPPGNTEVYVVIEAEPGATIRVGFAVDLDAATLKRKLLAGRRDQQTLLELADGELTPDALQAVLRPWLARREAAAADLEEGLGLLLGARWRRAVRLLRLLHALYWEVLDLMNPIPVSPGQVIYNATPPRLEAARGGVRSAEVHALGNAEGLEVVALEVRKPGITFRAWDNVRFPLRDIDIAAALGALNLSRTEPAEFLVERRPLDGRPGVAVSVDDEHFRLEHLTPRREGSVAVPAEPPHSLHVLAGAVSVYATDGECVGRLGRGDAALVPVGVGAYRVAADSADAELLKIGVPL